MVFRIDKKEEVRDVPGFGGHYQVSDGGRVLSRGHELSLIDGRYVNLCDKGVRQKIDVAYLVARAFLTNVEARPWLVHKDGDLRNNRAENLEWSEKRQEKTRGRKEHSHRVLQYSLDGGFVGEYSSVREAEEASGVARYLIRRNAEGKSSRAKNWIFRYAG